MRSTVELVLRGLSRLAHDDAEDLAYQVLSCIRSEVSEHLADPIERACWRSIDAAGEPEVECDHLASDRFAFSFADHYPVAIYAGPHWLRRGVALARPELAELLEEYRVELPADDDTSPPTFPLIVLGDQLCAVQREYRAIVGDEIVDFDALAESERTIVEGLERCACSLCARSSVTPK